MLAPGKLLVAMAIGVLPLLLAEALAIWVLTARHPQGAGLDALALLAFCLLSYGVACLVLIPALGVLAFFVRRQRLALSPALAATALLCLCALLLPPLYINLL
jgi:hypothetical protein